MGERVETGGNTFYCDIPTEVLTEILLRLPVKSLIRFTAVCKYLLELIRNDPNFARRHCLTKARPSPSTLIDHVDHLVDYGMHGRKCRSTVPDEASKVCLYSFTEKRKLRLAKKIEFGPEVDVAVSNFHHGLMCVYVTFGRSFGSKVMICNPAIGEVVPLPLPPHHILNMSTLPTPALGFDPKKNDYKVVLFWPPSNFARSKYWEVDVFSVRDGRWHSLPTRGAMNKFHRFLCEPVLNANGSILNWFGSLDSTDSKLAILAFDMADEVFQDVNMPNCLNPGKWRLHNIVTSSGCQANICCSSRPRFDPTKKEELNCADVWLLSKDDDQQLVWNKEFSFEFPDDLVVWPSNLWLNDNELFIYIGHHCIEEELAVFNWVTGEVARTGRLGDLSNPGGYAESLISIKQIISTSCLQAAAAQDEDEDKGSPACFMREVSGKKGKVRWSFNFKLCRKRVALVDALD